jgi:uncharacterized membrane-anchored protein
MTSATITSSTASSTARQMLNKVPQVTLYFWVIKILATTVGETFADFLALRVSPLHGAANVMFEDKLTAKAELTLADYNDTVITAGLTRMMVLSGVVLLVVLLAQFKSRRYVPAIYWLAVVVMSVFGTLVTDNFVENYGITKLTMAIVFAVLLALTFSVWYASEKTLSIHSITTTKRESFYWLAILFTFALGTATGDYIAETTLIGYLRSALIFAGSIALIHAAHVAFSNRGTQVAHGGWDSSVLAFWAAYVITRPLGASIGDLLSQATDSDIVAERGLGLGTTVTSVLFLSVILAVVTFVSVTKKDATQEA